MKLSPLALDEFKNLLLTPVKWKPGAKLKTETPPFRGGTQELCDLEVIEFVRDTGLETVYRLTETGAKLADELFPAAK